MIEFVFINKVILIDMPKPYQQTQINCLYKLEHRKIVLNNRSQSRDSLDKSLFQNS